LAAFRRIGGCLFNCLSFRARLKTNGTRTPSVLREHDRLASRQRRYSSWTSSAAGGP